MKRSWYSLAAVLLVMSLLSAEALASAAAGMLRSNGGVSVNGSPVNSVTTVFAGDRIETAPQSAASLTMNGSSLMVDPNSSLTFTGDEMNFYCGGGTVQASQGLEARFGRVEVKPTKGTARFQVQQSSEILRISAIDGDLTVSDGAKTVNLTPGNSTSVANLGCGQMAKNTAPQNVSNNANAAKTADTTSAASAPNGGAPAGLRGAIIPPTVVISLAVTGIILLQNTPISPSGP